MTEISLQNQHSKALIDNIYQQRDPEEEFFMLAVLSLKMVHNEEYDEAEYVYEISAGKLFRQVRNQNLPFHRWYKWLETKFADLRNAYMIEKTPKLPELSQWNLEADKQTEIREKEVLKKQNTKTSIYSRFKTYINKNKSKEMKHQQNLQSEKPKQAKDDNDWESKDDFTERLQPFITESAEKRRQTISESLADKG